MTAATDYLDTHHIPYRLFRHAGKVESLEQAAAERGQQPGQVVRTIVFRLSEGEFALALMAGPRQISWPALRHTLGQNRLTMAAAERSKPPPDLSPARFRPSACRHRCASWSTAACLYMKRSRLAPACAVWRSSWPALNC